MYYSTPQPLTLKTKLFYIIPYSCEVFMQSDPATAWWRVKSTEVGPRGVREGINVLSREGSCPFGLCKSLPQTLKDSNLLLLSYGEKEAWPKPVAKVSGEAEGWVTSGGRGYGSSENEDACKPGRAGCRWGKGLRTALGATVTSVSFS